MHATDRNLPSRSLAEFRERLPKKPYHTDQIGDFLRIHRADIAVRARYIQFNGPTHQHWLVFDIDRPGAALDWEDRHVPPPNFTVQNPINGHAHLFYGLSTPVRTAPDGRIAPLKYAAAVQRALRSSLGADMGYSGFLCKNPFNSYWRTAEWEPRLYELADFEGWLDLSAKPREAANSDAYGLGRNCTLFESLRQWAYKAIRQGWPEYERWHVAVLERARAYNDFEAPLPDSEVRATAKSVSKWTHQRLTPSKFAAVQAHRGRKKGEKLRDDTMPWVKEMASRGVSIAEIARESGVSRQTIYNWIRRLDGATSKSDNV